MPRLTEPSIVWLARLAFIAFCIGVLLELDRQILSDLRIAVPFIYEGAGVGFDEAVPRIIVPLAAFGLLVGLVGGSRMGARPLPVVAAAVMVALYVIYMMFVWLAGTDPNYAFGNLDDENAPQDFVAKGGVVYGVIVGIGLLSIWAGIGVTQLCHDAMAVFRKLGGTDGPAPRGQD